MTPSSEEIAAALEVAIRLCNLGEPVTLGESAKSLPVLRAHLSRLREEALEVQKLRDEANHWRQAHAGLWELVVHAERIMDEHGVPTNGLGILTWWYRVKLACEGKPWPKGYECLTGPHPREFYEWQFANEARALEEPRDA